MKILRDSYIPIHKQLEDLLVHKIRMDKLKPGDRFYSEFEIARKYAVSRSTVRNVYERLVTKNIILRRAGKGTYVSLPPAPLNGSLLVGFTKKISAVAVSPKTKLITCEVTRILEKNVKEKLRIPENDKVIEVKRVRYIKDIPFVIHRAFLPFERCKPVLEADLETISLTDFIQKILKIQISYAEEIIYCFPAEEEDAKLLEIKSGYPILAVDGVSFDRSGEPIRYSLSKYRSDIVRLKSTNETSIKNV